MEPRERFMTAVRLGEPDRVPIYDFEIEPVLVEQITGEKTSGFDIFSAVSGGGKDASEVRIDNIRKKVRCCRKLGFDAIGIPYQDLQSDEFKPTYIKKDTFIDEWGRIFRIDELTKTTWWVDGTIKTHEDLDDLVPPDPRASGTMDALNEAKEENNDEMAVVGFGDLTFTVWELLGGIDKFIFALYEEPEFARDLLKTYADVNCELAKAMVDVGLDVFTHGDDYADSHGPLISPRLFREFIFPHDKRIVDEIRKKDRKIPILKHSDGNNWPIIDDLIDYIGIEGFHPWQPGDMDLKEGKERYGDRLCLLGAVDCVHVLPYGSEADVRRDVRKCIDAAGAGGGYILSSSNSLHSNVRADNILTMVDEAKKYGKYPLKTDKKK